MARIEFNHTDSPGTIRDIDAFRLPSGVYSDSQNMTFKDERLAKSHGYAAFVSSPVIAGRTIHFCPLNQAALWMYTGLTAVYAFDGTPTPTDITRVSGAYTGTDNDRWTFAFLHGLGIVNNGVDKPQLWSPPALSQKLIDLTNWTDVSCRAMRSYRNYLVALDVTLSGPTRHSQMVKWSDAADPGTVPGSWDETDITKQSGETTLSDTPGAVIDCLPLGAANIIYKEDAVHSMNYIGGRFIFSFQKLPLSFGVIGTDLVAQIPRKHFVVTPDDILVHDGNQAQSVIDKRNRTWLFNNIDPAGIQNSYVLPYYSRGEIWYFFPLIGSSVPTQVLIWNYENNSISFRDMPISRHAVFTPAIQLSAGDSFDFGFDDNDDRFDTESVLLFDDPSFLSTRARTLFINETDGTIDEFDESIFTDGGSNVRSFAERQSMPFVGTDQQGRPMVDFETVKFVHEIWPRITGTDGAAVSVYFGTQMKPDDTIDWADPITFTIGTTEFIPVFKTCRFLSVRFEATDSQLFEIQGFAYTLEPSGVF